MKNLTNPQRNFIFQQLLLNSINGKLPYGTLTKVARDHGTSSRTIQRIWLRGIKSMNSRGVTPGDVQSRRKGKVGPKTKYTPTKIQEKIGQLTLSRRTTLRRMEQFSGIPRSTLQRAKANGHLIRHSSTVKPRLSSRNKIERMNFSLSFIQRVNNSYVFSSMHDMVHIDEKWFDMMKVKESYYLVPSEIEPYRYVQSKRFIGRVMFVCAVARPRYDYRKRRMFDGKIGIWPFVEKVAAKRNSKNRPAGTIEVKPITVTRDVYREYLENKVFPAIRSKFPFQRHTRVRLQQDNAKPHISENDDSILHQSFVNSQRISILCQPANSPDLNILDLSFFNAIQSVQNKIVSNNVEELISAVEKSFKEYPYSKINDAFITLQSIMEQTLDNYGSNNFKISHGKKRGIPVQQRYDYNITCDPDTYNTSKQYLQGNRA